MPKNVLPRLRRPLRVVVDTNAWIRFLLHPGALSSFWRPLLESKRVRLLLSQELLAEIGEILSRYHTDPAELVAFVRGVVARKQAQLVVVTSTVEDCVDPDDNFLLALAKDGRADLLVSGDRHLLDLGPARYGARIVAYEAFRAWRAHLLV